MSDNQLGLFYDVLDAFLSTDGYNKVNYVTQYAEAVLYGYRSSMWDPDYYYIALFGDPDTDGSWGFQLDGHHCAVNFLVHGDKVSMVPAFLGAEPVTVTVDGVETSIFGDERSLAFTLLNSLDETQLATAIQSGNQSIKVGPPSSANDMEDPYRSYDYSVWIEFNNESPVATEGGWTAVEHAHSMIRIPVNTVDSDYNDYGIFAMQINNSGPRTLEEHYANADHHRDAKRESFLEQLAQSSRAKDSDRFDHFKRLRANVN